MLIVTALITFIITEIIFKKIGITYDEEEAIRKEGNVYPKLSKRSIYDNILKLGYVYL